MRSIPLWLLIAAASALPLFLRAETASSPVPGGTEAVAARYAEVLQRPEYQSHREPDLLAEAGRWIISALQSVQDSFNQYQYSSQLIRLSYALLWSIFVLSAGSLLYWGARLLVLRRLFDRPAHARPTGRSYLPTPESFEAELKQARERGDWNGALRISWRQFLSQLEERDMAAADRTRTNREYLVQIERQPLPAPAREGLAALVRDYDFFVYGHRAATAEDWNRWETALASIAHTLKLPRVS